MKDKIVTAMTAGWRPALMSAVWMFVGSFGAELIGFLEMMQEALAGDADYPDPSVLGAAAVSAGMAFLGAVVAFVIRGLQAVVGMGKPPSYN